MLRRSSPAILDVWDEQDKSTPILLENNEFFVASGGIAWVEWDSMDPTHTASTLELAVLDRRTNREVFSPDRLNFYPFKSTVVVFGGRDAQPLAPDNGAFTMAIDLYNNGYDVHAYDESVVDDAAEVPYWEVRHAVENRGVTKVAIFGHSYGGGATYVLANGLKNYPPQGSWTLAFTAYIDAVVHDGSTSEERRPPGSKYHVNYYQTHGAVDGEATDANDADGPTTNVDVTDPPWGEPLYHTVATSRSRYVAQFRMERSRFL